jgi:hypothetical protein
MAAAEAVEPESSVNREELFDALVGRGFHPGGAQRGAGPMKSYTFTMKATVSFDAVDGAS